MFKGYKEAKVGVIFWSKDHEKLGKKRGVIRQREYVATRHELRTLARMEIYFQVSVFATFPPYKHSGHKVIRLEEVVRALQHYLE
ncbi:hypothetical protein H6G04_33675 [Calothrix membranacea FACHB-236]|nr:hypothetical protein [Calothrix membranacea FACHB-236]